MLAYSVERRTAASGNGRIAEECRAYVSAVVPSGDAQRLLTTLRHVERCLNGWRAMALERAAAAGAPAPPPLSLGAFTRHLVRWLDAHPHRADEPVEWLIQDALDALSPPQHQAAALLQTTATAQPQRLIAEWPTAAPA